MVQKMFWRFVPETSISCCDVAIVYLCSLAIQKSRICLPLLVGGVYDRAHFYLVCTPCLSDLHLWRLLWLEGLTGAPIVILANMGQFR
jgi:hypothetical protein